MGNNQLMLLQFPRTYYFFATAWDTRYLDRSRARRPARPCRPALSGASAADRGFVPRVARGRRRADLVACCRGSRRSSARRIQDARGRSAACCSPTRSRWCAICGCSSRFAQARQAFIAAMRGKPTVPESARLVERYFDRLLAWNKETGWDKMIDITVWPQAHLRDRQGSDRSGLPLETAPRRWRTLYELRPG